MQLQGKITEYIPNAMRDHYDDGTEAVYDKVAIAINSPDYPGPNPLNVFLDKTEEVADCWKSPGSMVAFKLDPDDLKFTQLFFHALEEATCKP